MPDPEQPTSLLQELTLPPVENSVPVQPEPAAQTAPTESPPVPSSESVATPAPSFPTPPPLSPSQSTPSTSQSLLSKALEKIQFRKKSRLDKIMKLAQEKKSITNNEVEKLLRVSDATATRYLNALVKQNKLKVSGHHGSARYEPTIGSNPGN